MTLEDVFAQAFDLPASAWLYLPSEVMWELTSEAAILESEEVTPDEEDDPDAGIPQFAKANGLKQVLPVSVIQDIVENIKYQVPGAQLDQVFKAFLFYFEHDAFMEL